MDRAPTPAPAPARPTRCRPGHPARCPVHALLLLLALLALAPAPAAHAPHDTVEVLVFSPDFASDGLALASCILSEKPLLARTLDGGQSWQLYGVPMALDTISQIAFSPDFATDRRSISVPRASVV